MSLSSASSSGDRLKTLIELRDSTALRLELAQSDQNFTILGRLLIDTMNQIAELEGREIGDGGTALDELAKRRAAAGRPDASRKTGAGRQSS